MASRRRSRSRRASLRRKIVRDLTGQTWFKQRFGDFGKKLKARKAGEPLLPIVGAEIVKQRRWLLANAAVILRHQPRRRTGGRGSRCGCCLGRPGR